MREVNFPLCFCRHAGERVKHIYEKNVRDVQWPSLRGDGHVEECWDKCFHRRLGLFWWRTLRNIYNNSWHLWHLQFVNQYCKHYLVYSFQSPDDAFIIITIYKREGSRLRSWCLILTWGCYIFSKCESDLVTPLLKKQNKGKETNRKNLSLQELPQSFTYKQNWSPWFRDPCLVWPLLEFLASSPSGPFLFQLPDLSVTPTLPHGFAFAPLI